MLVLTRRVNQSINIGDDIQITLCWVGKGKYAKIGIQAPQQVKILRTELDPVFKQSDVRACTDDSPPLNKFLKD